MESKSKNDFLMWSLIRMLGTQKAVAKVLNQSKQTFNYWLNYANKVPPGQVVAMERLLKALQEKKRGSNYISLLNTRR